MKNLLFHLKAVKTGTLKAQVGAGASSRSRSRSGSRSRNFLKVGAGAEKNSFGSATLVLRLIKQQFQLGPLNITLFRNFK